MWTIRRKALLAGPPKAKASEPASSSQGTILSNDRAGVSNRSSAPASPPARLTGMRARTGKPPIGVRSYRYARAAARLPGHRATVLDAFASTGGTPTATSAGRVTNEPPPAAAFIAPASRPAPHTRAACVASSVGPPPRRHLVASTARLRPGHVRPGRAAPTDRPRFRGAREG